MYPPRSYRHYCPTRRTNPGEIDRPARAAGASKYSSIRLLQLAMDGIFAFSVVPLRIATVLGGIAILVAISWALFVVVTKLVLDRSPQGFSSLIITIVFLSGANLFFLGIIGEYIGRIYEESKGRPQYLVKQRLGRQPGEPPGLRRHGF